MLLLSLLRFGNSKAIVQWRNGGYLSWNPHEQVVLRIDAVILEDYKA